MMKVQVKVFWVMIPCRVEVGYQRIGGHHCLYLQGEDGCSKIGTHEKAFSILSHPSISTSLVCVSLLSILSHVPYLTWSLPLSFVSPTDIHSILSSQKGIL